MELLFNIGFLSIRIWDILDIAIVGYLMYRIYKLLRGSVAFNIFVGVVSLYAVWWIVRELDMDLLSGILGQFGSVGVIIIIIIFQPEVRRFLLLLGDTTLRQRSKYFGKLLDGNVESKEERKGIKVEIQNAIMRMSRQKVGALIVLTKEQDVDQISNSKVILDANISQPLIESIFAKESPLHDGAIIIYQNKILAASAILPVSESRDLPKRAGLRHRAAVGITEKSKVVSIVVSEETGTISFAAKRPVRIRSTRSSPTKSARTRVFRRSSFPPARRAGR